MRTILTALILTLAFVQPLSAQNTKAATRKPAPTKSTPAAAAAPAKPSSTCNCPALAAQPHYRPYIDTGNLTERNGSSVPTKEWRDDAGREREDIYRTSSDGTPYRDVSVYDPIEKVRMSWSVGKPNTPGVVTIYPFHQSQLMPLGPQPAPVSTPANRTYYPRHTESLPPQVIAGLYAEGMRTTTTTPAGTRGNDHDIVATTETWTSPDTGIQLRNISDYPPLPRAGAEMTSVEFVTPDPAIFKAPEGYEVKYATPKPTPAPAPVCNCSTPTAPAPLPIQPYSGKTQSTHVQTLADGTTVTTVNTAQVWRDANGRMRSDSFNTGADGEPTHFVSIYDPVRHIRMNWSLGNPVLPKVVNLSHYSQPVPQPAPLTPQPVARRYYPTTSESLPPQTINGIYVEGTRTTRTTPAGYIGNDRDITVTTETWTSPEFHTTIRRIVNDPREGKTTTETTDYQQAPPDPALFNPPADFTIRETNQQ